MAYDETSFRRQTDEQPSDPAAYRANTLAAAEQQRRAVDMMDEITADTGGAHAAVDDGRDRLAIHLGWEVVLLLAAAAFGFLLYRLDPNSL